MIFLHFVIKRDKRFILDASALLIDSENLISFYNKMKGIRYFTLKAYSWLIRVRNGNIDAFIQILPSIYKTLYPGGCDREEFLEKIKALSEVKLFTIGLMNKDVLYIEDGNFDTVLQVLTTKIKQRTNSNLFKGCSTSVVSYLPSFLIPQFWSLYLFSQKAMFKEVYIGECNFTEDQIRELRAKVKEVYGDNLEIVDKKPS